MTLHTRSLDESLPTMETFEHQHRGAWTESKAELTSCEIVRIDSVRAKGLVPERFASIGDVIKSSESMPERKAALVAARQKLAKLIKREDGGQTLKSFRLNRGMSQQSFAELVGTTQPYIARLEANPSKAGLDFMRKFGKVFELDMNTVDSILQ